jgi:SAM-dependent methyltransferase
VQHNYFDGAVAERYDESSAEMFAPEVLGPTVDLLAALADGKPALEFAVGTGRVALPLSARGVRVLGIELSEAMVAQLRAKPGAEAVDVAIGDMTTTRVDGRFGLVYLVFNTIKNLLTQDAQVRCFENAATHLEPGGCFVIETSIPILQRLPPGEVFRTFSHTETYLGFDEYDVVEQRLWSHHYSFDGTTYRRNSVPFRYAWPAELDLMARIAGLRLLERWADWDRSPFTSESPKHVSVWQKPV